MSFISSIDTNIVLNGRLHDANRILQLNYNMKKAGIIVRFVTEDHRLLRLITNTLFALNLFTVLRVTCYGHGCRGTTVHNLPSYLAVLGRSPTRLYC